jgi:integrase
LSKKITNTFENLLSKYRINGLSQVVDFLQSRARRSGRTAFAYSFALDHFNNFIEQKYSGYNIQTILKPLNEKPSPVIDVYVLLDKFVSYLHNDTANGKDLSPISVKLYMAAVKSYLTYNDIELAPNRFNRRVTMPRIYREDEEAIDGKDIRQILLACNNRRLRAYLLVLASGGMRATEALAIRLRDLDFNISPTKVHIRKEFAKTRVARDIYISDEATKYLKQWIEWKYRERKYEIKKKVKSDDDTVFSIVSSSKDAHALYTKVLLEFQKVLDVANLKLRKEGGVYKRRKITFHSFRRFVKSTLSDQVGFDFSSVPYLLEKIKQIDLW